MFRPASRLIARAPALRTQLPRVAPPTRRFLSTAPPTQKSRSWKSLTARLGLVGAFIYYYNTTDVFAEEPRHEVHALPETNHETEQLQTIDALAQERQKRKAAEAQALSAASPATDTAAAQGAEGGIGGLEEEAGQQGAFNPETGEINWDCPCLGGMANGPCGEEFKAAFSCFVYSQEEPKGMDCIDKFKNMQNCFRQYPEVYGSELEPEDEDDVASDPQQQPLAAADATAQPTENVDAATPQEFSVAESEHEARAQRAKAATEQVKQEFGEPIKDHVKSIVADEKSKTTKEPSETDEVVQKEEKN